MGRSFLKGLRYVPRPLVVCGLLSLASVAGAQDPVRPWLPWLTIRTANYRFHFTPELEGWTRRVAERVESLDSALGSLVGYTPDRPVHVVVDDPFSISNGYALPMIERPVSVWWATPPDPRNDIGNYRTWGEMLAVHELTHIAHLTRPSRNWFQRALWASLPTNLGPIARKTPRWVVEGYATLIEGRITGTGRPNNTWRPAILRQWALEGRLPTVTLLNAWDDFRGGEFAYLSGSAYLEWLSRRQGDSSLVHVWRRLTARSDRTFDASFTGVFGDSPGVLYGRHVAELTRDAMAAKGELERAGLVEGELIQHLSWETGDPAVSPNGEMVTVMLRERDRPARVVVWKTAADPEDTAATRKRLEAQRKDPLDVPDLRFYPPRKKPVKSLAAWNGRSFQQPRWFADNRRVLLTRWRPRPDGSVSSDLYVWDTETNGVKRITRGNGVMHGDPAPDGANAVAMQCHWGHCDIARVDLDRGVMTTLLEGNAETSYYRPRYSPDGARIAANIAENGRWRVVVADRNGGMMHHADPDDGANRYDAEWMGPDSLVVVSELGGVANLELIELASGKTRTLTRVTGAAVAPGINRADRSIWFLNLHSRGYDVRRLARDATPADTVVPVTAERFGFAGVRVTRDSVPLRVRPVGPSRPYRSGPRQQRWLPGAYASADGAGGSMTVFSGDIVGRFNAVVAGAYGQRGTWQGGALRAAWRYPRPALELGIRGFLHEPSFAHQAQPRADTIDAAVLETVLAASVDRRGDGWQLSGRVGGSAGTIDPRIPGESYYRGLAFAEAGLQLVQAHGARGMIERLRVHVTQGHTGSAYRRVVSTLELATTGRDMMPVELHGTFGRLVGSPHPFERFTIGGVASPVGDSSTLSQRYGMPMFPTGIAGGSALLAWRIALPRAEWTPFFEGASTSDAANTFPRWHRALGLDFRAAVPPIPVAFVPRAYARLGAAYTLDAPVRRKVRAFLEMRIEP